jgi:hypothetical protein
MATAACVKGWGSWRRQIICTVIGGASRSGRKTTPSRRYWAVVPSAGRDNGEPVIDVAGVPEPGPRGDGPQVGGGGAGAPVDEHGALRYLVEPDRAPPFFGVFMSVNPVFAALTGLVVLGQSVALVDWLAIATIVTANAVSVSSRRT